KASDFQPLTSVLSYWLFCSVFKERVIMALSKPTFSLYQAANLMSTIIFIELFYACAVVLR
ncbi:hypothetical protein ACFSUO_10680, partial [Lentibacillus juripiscarius]